MSNKSSSTQQSDAMQLKSKYLLILTLFALLLNGCDSTSSNGGDDLPDVAAISISGVTDTDALFEGFVDYYDDMSTIEVGVCWSTNPEQVGECLPDDGDSNIFRVWMEDLDPDTEYFARAYVSKIGSEKHSEEVLDFTTEPKEKWSVQYSSSVFNFYDVFILDENTVFAAGNRSLFVTYNGGMDWEVLGQFSKNVKQIQFLDNERGFINIENDGILKTVDGGTTWSNSADEVDYYHPLPIASSFMFTNDGTGVAAGYRMMLITQDSGQTWTNVSNDLIRSLDIKDVHIDANQLKIWAVAKPRSGQESGTTVIFSDNLGETWSIIYEDNHKSPRALTILDSDYSGWVVGDNGLALATSDAEKSFTPVDTGTAMDLTGVSVVNDSEGSKIVYAVGRGSHLIKSYDLGETWELESNPGVPTHMNSIKFHDSKSIGWAVGSGQILHYNDD